MRILVSNDDGVRATGLTVLANALKTIGDVTVIAPDRDRSGASNSLTLRRPIRLQNLENGFISVEGTPTDCIHLAVTGLFPKEEIADVVVAGINQGANLGDDVFYSGTVAAAMEGSFLGLPAIAVSLVLNGGYHYQTAAEVVKQLVLKVRHEPLPVRTMLNVNVPDVPITELRGFEVTRLGTRHCAEPTIADKDPRGAPIYWIGPAGPEQDSGVGTDFYAINQKKVSITPLHLDLTHYKLFDQLAAWAEGLQ